MAPQRGRPDRPAPSTPPAAWPELVVEAVEQANWRAVLYDYYPDLVAVAQGQDAVLLTILRSLAEVMRWQARGRLARAWQELDGVARLLPLPMSPQRRGHGTPYIELVEMPSATQGLLPWTWRTGCVAWREQREMLDLRSRMGQAGPREVLVNAVVEYLRCVEWDPWTWGPILRDEDALDVTRSRAELLARATDLRRVAIPNAGDVSATVWRACGGYRALHAEALRQLATSDVVPWLEANPLATAVPIRCGRVSARRHAKLLIKAAYAYC
jgi:hypothetical protein